MSKQKRLKINISEVEKIVFCWPYLHRLHAPAPLHDVQQVPGCRLLCSVLSSSLSVRDHVDYIRKRTINPPGQNPIQSEAMTTSVNVRVQLRRKESVTWELRRWKGEVLPTEPKDFGKRCSASIIYMHGWLAFRSNGFWCRFLPQQWSNYGGARGGLAHLKKLAAPRNICFERVQVGL